MDTLFRRRRTPAAFTLVEMLTVIVIIGILSGALLVAVNAVRTRATQSVVLMQITELGRALETYKGDIGDYPPDFAGVDLPPGDPVGDAAKARVIAHLRKAFPKYRPIGDGTAGWNDWQKFCYDVTLRYPNVDPANFDPSAALVFWLGGLPERVGDRTKPAGFHSDPRMPFKPGLPRSDPPFKFAPDDLLLIPGMVQFSPNRLHEKTPVIYFRSYRSQAGLFEYTYAGTSLPKVYPWTDQYGGLSYCVPYLAPPEPPATNGKWRNLETYQIICAGSDGSFGQTLPTSYRYTKSGDGFTAGDFDNLTNFYTAGDLEGELQ